MGCGSSALVLGGLTTTEQAGGALIDGVLGRTNDGQPSKLVQSHALKLVYVKNNRETVSFKMDGMLVAKLAIESAFDGFVVRNASGNIGAVMLGSDQEVMESIWGRESKRKFVKRIATVYSATPRREGQKDALTVEGVPLYEWATITIMPTCVTGGSSFASVVRPYGSSTEAPQMVVHSVPNSIGAKATSGQSNELIGKCAALNIKVGAGVDPMLIALAMIDFDGYADNHGVSPSLA